MSAGTPLAQLISQHAIPLVLAVFIVVLLTATAVLLVGGGLWRRRARVWALAGKGMQRIGRIPLLAGARQRYPAAFRFLSRLTPTAFLEVYLLAGMLMSLGVLAFLALAERVSQTSGLVAFDHQLASALQNTWTPRTVTALSRLTILGGGIALAVIGVGVGLLLLLRKQKILTIGWSVAVLGASVLTGGLKAAFQRVRPEYAHISGYSFPSGHALGSLVTYGMLAYLLTVFLPRGLALVFAAFLLLLVLFIGFSRLYLGVHYFSDVIAGYSAAVVWLAMCISGIEIARLREHRRNHA